MFFNNYTAGVKCYQINKVTGMVIEVAVAPRQVLMDILAVLIGEIGRCAFQRAPRGVGLLTQRNSNVTNRHINHRIIKGFSAFQHSHRATGFGKLGSIGKADANATIHGSQDGEMPGSFRVLNGDFQLRFLSSRAGQRDRVELKGISPFWHNTIYCASFTPRCRPLLRVHIGQLMNISVLA